MFNIRLHLKNLSLCLRGDPQIQHSSSMRIMDTQPAPQAGEQPFRLEKSGRFKVPVECFRLESFCEMA